MTGNINRQQNMPTSKHMHSLLQADTEQLRFRPYTPELVGTTP